MHRVRPLSRIGEGPSGEVFIGLDEVLQRRVVIKKLATDSFESADLRRRLLQEAAILARLDHPNVLRIHHYAEEEGRDVFTLEFAHGATLPEALARGLDFDAKVGVATAVAGALAVVHRHGIVHGALSPESVVIAENGEVKVVDFASTSRQLERPRADARWCSPEQSRGEAPAHAADMYAFGLVLREMFGTTDRDVRGIVAALLCDAPSERATAARTLTVLERLAARPVRRARLAAVTLVAAFFLFGGVKYMADLRRERSEAIAAQAEAEARRAQVNDLVAFMIQDIQPKLVAVGRLEILDATTEKALAYFASFRPGQISPAEAAVNVQALAQVGQTQLARANLPAALRTLREAVRLADDAVRRQPGDDELRYAAGNTHAMLSNALEKDGDLAGALLHAQEFARTSADLAQRHPRDVRFMRFQAYAHSNLGSLFDRSEDIAASFRELEVAVAAKRHALPLENTDDMKFDLAITATKSGAALLKLGRFPEARIRLEEQRATMETLLKRRPAHKRMSELLAVCDDHLAAVAFATGDLAAASRHAAAHLSTGQRLAAFEPGNMDWTRHLAVAHRSSGTAARMTGNVGKALQHHAVSVEILHGVLASGKQTKPLVRELALSRIELARSLLAAGRVDSASAQADLAVEGLRPFRGELPAQKVAGDAFLVQGETRAARGDLAGATASWEDAQSIAGPLDRRSPDPRVADTHARVLLRLDRFERAEPLLRELGRLGYANPEFKALSRDGR